MKAPENQQNENSHKWAADLTGPELQLFPLQHMSSELKPNIGIVEPIQEEGLFLGWQSFPWVPHLL